MLLKDFVGHHRQVSTDGGWGGRGRRLVSVSNEDVTDIKTGTAYIGAIFIIVFFRVCSAVMESISS